MFSYLEVVKHSNFTPEKGQEDKSNIDIVNFVEFSIKGDSSSTLPDNVIEIRKNSQPSSPKENISMSTFPPMRTRKVSVEGNTSDSLSGIVKKMKKCNHQCNPLKENILIRKFPRQLSLTLEKKKTTGADILVEKNPPQEKVLKEKLMMYNLTYVPPTEGEDKKGQALRHKRLYYMLQEEKKIIDEMMKYNLSYIGPSVGEEKKGQESRHRNLRRMINEKVAE